MAEIVKPNMFKGERNSNEVENLICEMERYFVLANVQSDQRVAIASMYLVEGAKNWWKTYARYVSGIEKWDVFVTALKDHFLPTNSSWAYTRRLKSLKQDGPVRRYMNEFVSLLFNISEISEEDKFHAFMSGLKSLIQIELRKQGVFDFASAKAAICSLETLSSEEVCCDGWLDELDDERENVASNDLDDGRSQIPWKLRTRYGCLLRMELHGWTRSN